MTVQVHHVPPPLGEDGDFKLLREALEGLVQVVPGATVAPTATPISKFKASYARVLSEVNDGHAHIITQGRKRYIIFSEDQVRAMVHAGESPIGLGTVFATMPTPTAPRTPMQTHVTEPEAEQYALRRRK